MLRVGWRGSMQRCRHAPVPSSPANPGKSWSRYPDDILGTHRIGSDDDSHEYLLGRRLGTAWALLIQIAVHVPLSSHSAARSRWGALRSEARRHRPPAGTSRATPPGPLNATK